jgi:small GTP-binding protein
MNTGPGHVKTVFLGESGSGKTSIITAHIHRHFPLTNSPTVGASFLEISLPWNKTEVKFAIWDTAGQEVYRSLTPMYFHGAKCAVVTFDLTNHASFEKVTDSLSELQQTTPNIVIIICGNKSDLEDERTVSFEEASELAGRFHLTYIETSAKNGVGLDTLFSKMAQLVGESNPELMRDCQIDRPQSDRFPDKETHCC